MSNKLLPVVLTDAARLAHPRSNSIILTCIDVLTAPMQLNII